MQILQSLQKRRDNLTPPEQNVYKQLLGKYNLMVQHQQQQLRPNYQPVPQSGTVAQTGFSTDNSANFQAATGQSHQNAGMPYNSANVSRTNNGTCSNGMQVTPSVSVAAPPFTQISSTSSAENMLKKFPGGAINPIVNIKKEIDDSACGSTSPANNVADSTTHVQSRAIKCEATSTSVRPMFMMTDVKHEPSLKIENIFGPPPKTQYTTDMDSRQIDEAVK